MPDQEFIYKSTLKTTYNLPDSWITRLGPPDQTVPNPHYKSGPLASLYSRCRVEEFIEANRAEYDQMIAKRAERQTRVKAVIGKRAAELLAWANEAEVKVIGNLPENLEELEQWAAVNFYAFVLERRHYEEFEPSYGRLIAYLRHVHTNYERLLGKIEGKPGCGMAYSVIKQRCNEVVEALYRELTGPAPEDQVMAVLGEEVAPRLPGM